MERGLWLVRCWPALIVGDNPLIESTGGLASPYAARASDSRYCRAPSLFRMSNPRVDLPEPKIPLSTTIWFLGMSRLILFKLWGRGPRIWGLLAKIVAEPINEREQTLRLVSESVW